MYSTVSTRTKYDTGMHLLFGIFWLCHLSRRGTSSRDSLMRTKMFCFDFLFIKSLPTSYIFPSQPLLLFRILQCQPRTQEKIRQNIRVFAAY
jgi:hypothetical protein